MKTTFLYIGPQPIHKAWAESINAEFVCNRFNEKEIKGMFGRFLKSFSILKQIPKDTDFLLCESGTEIPAGAFWKFLNPRKKTALIIDDPKLWNYWRMNFVERLFLNFCLKQFDLLLPTTELMYNLIPKDLQHKSAIVPIWFDVTRFSKVSVNLKNKNIVFVGFLGELKGIDAIADAFKLVQRDFPESRLYLVGEGPLKQKYENESGIICTGWSNEPEKFMGKGSIYLNLALIEPAGAAILEAMCIGLIPVVSENVGVKNEVEKVSNELAVKSPEDAYKLIKKLWQNPKLMQSYSENAIAITRKMTKESSIEKFKKAISYLD